MLGFWLSASWDHVGRTEAEMEALWPRWLSLLRAVRGTGLPRIGLLVSGPHDRVVAVAQRLLAAAPATCPTCGAAGPSLWVGVCTAELGDSAPLDGPAEPWARFRRTLVWLYEQFGTPPLLDFEWSLLNWLDGQPGHTLDLPAFARGARALRNLGFPLLVYPSQYAGASERRDAFQAVLAGALNDGMIVMGTTYHSPAAAAEPRNAHVRQLEAALSVGARPQQQIIVGPPDRPWFSPATLAAAVQAVPSDHDVHVWPQFDFIRGDPATNLMPEVLDAARACLATRCGELRQEVLDGTT